MSDKNELNRRQLIGISGCVLTTGLAGCSGSSGDSTPDDDDSATPTATEEGTPTATEDGPTTELPESGATNVIESLAEYREVANDPDEWVGEQVAANDVSYYRSYEEEYEAFRAVYHSENTARPFLLKNVQPNTNNERDEFTDGEEISFEGTVEKTGQIRNVKVIFVEDVTIE